MGNKPAGKEVTQDRCADGPSRHPGGAGVYHLAPRMAMIKATWSELVVPSLRQEDCGFKASLGHILRAHCRDQNNSKKTNSK